MSFDATIKPEILKNRTALVTGAGGGIGSRVAIRLSQAGANVALHYYRREPLEVFKELSGDKSASGETCMIQADFGDDDFATGLLDNLETNLALPDILVNCAARQDVGEIKSLSEAQFDSMIKTNLSALFSLSNQFAKRQPENPRTNASIINISSIEAIRPAFGHGHYATSKAAVEALTKSMALEYGSTGLRVNAIAPGLIHREGIETDWPQGVDSWNKHCPLGRMGTPDDIAEAVLFLVSPAAGFITGTVLTIDGGMSVAPGW